MGSIGTILFLNMKITILVHWHNTDCTLVSETNIVTGMVLVT